jgi:hypothetical protein
VPNVREGLASWEPDRDGETTASIGTSEALQAPTTRCPGISLNAVGGATPARNLETHALTATVHGEPRRQLADHLARFVVAPLYAADGRIEGPTRWRRRGGKVWTVSVHSANNSYTSLVGHRSSYSVTFMF